MDSPCCSSGGAGKFFLGVITGVAIGATVGITLCPSRREIKRMTNKATRQMSDMVEHLSEILVK